MCLLLCLGVAHCPTAALNTGCSAGSAQPRAHGGAYCLTGLVPGCGLLLGLSRARLCPLPLMCVSFSAPLETEAADSAITQLGGVSEIYLPEFYTPVIVAPGSNSPLASPRLHYCKLILSLKISFQGTTEFPSSLCKPLL